MPDRLVAGCINHVDFAARFAGDVKALAIGRRAHALRLLPDRNDMRHLATGDVNYASRFDVFVGYIEFGPGFAEGEFLGIGSHREFAGQLPLRDVDHANAIGGFIGVRSIIVVIILASLEDRIALGIQLRWWGNGSATHGHVDRLSVRAHLDAARPLADRNRRYDFGIAAVDDRDIAGFLVGYKDLVILTRQCLCRQRRARNQCQAKSKA